MSKPNPGSVAHPKPRQIPAIPKPRPPPPPLRTIHRPSPSRVQQELPSAGAVAQEAQPAAEATSTRAEWEGIIREKRLAHEEASTRTLWETIIRRKKLAYAIAFGVVVVAGSILGARVKETRQEYAKRQELEEAAKRLAEATAAASAVTTGTKIQESTALQEKKSEPVSVTQALAQQGSALSVDIARQIALLEDRKVILNRQKANYEQKIQRLRERKVRKQEMEARRPQPTQVDR